MLGEIMFLSRFSRQRRFSRTCTLQMRVHKNKATVHMRFSYLYSRMSLGTGALVWRRCGTTAESVIKLPCSFTFPGQLLIWMPVYGRCCVRLFLVEAACAGVFITKGNFSAEAVFCSICFKIQGTCGTQRNSWDCTQTLCSFPGNVQQP